MEKKKIYVSDCPDLLLEWDYEKNEGLFYPDKVSVGSESYKIHWKCMTCGHRWEAPAYRRYHRKSSCPKCAKKKSRLKIGENDLASQYPDLLKEWDYEKNAGMYIPEEVAVGNARSMINWKCSVCGFGWATTAYSRTHQKSGCPMCVSKKMSEQNRVRQYDADKNLVAIYPDIAKEWHPIKNLPRVLDEIMPGCNDKVWWLCSTCGTEYNMAVCNRTGNKHGGCPTCNKHMHTSFPEQAIFFYIKQIFHNAQSGFTDFFEKQMELDIFIPELMTGIEYDGCFWHTNAVIERNKKKYSVCQKKKITLVRVKEDYKRHEICKDDCDVVIIRDDNTDDGLKKTIISLFNALGKTFAPDIDIARDRNEIKSNYITSFREKSLLERFPNIASEWHPVKNGNLMPDMVMPASAEKVWWLCPKCGQSYQASPAKRTRKEASACPVCVRKKIVSGVNDLAHLYPEIAMEWHPHLNGELLAANVAPNYSKKVWWRCDTCGYEFQMTPNKRVSAKQGCKYCAKRRTSEAYHKRSLNSGMNTVAEQRPDLLLEWDYEKNATICEPNDITIGNPKNVHWICSRCGYKWSASVYTRAKLGRGCQLCAAKANGEKTHSRMLRKGINDVASQRPDLLLEWDYERNTEICSPDDITVGSNKTVYWICSVCGYRWHATPYNRIHNGSGCRKCSRRKNKLER